MVKEILSNRFNININKEGATPPSNIQKEILSNTFSLNINKVGTIPPSGTQKEILSNTFSLNINKVQIQNKPPVITNLEYSLSERNCIINFNIFDEDNDKMNVYLIKNGQEELIFSNQSSGEKTITVYNLETGITTISIRVSDGKSNAYSEIFDVEIEGVVENRPPTITDVKHSVLGKNCTIDFNIHDLDGDKMDVYLIKNGKEELTLSKQTSGKKTISVNNLSTGNHIMSLKVSDGKLNTYSENFKVTIEEKEEIVNNPPTISNIKTSKTTALGSYELEFEIRDTDNDKMDVYLKIDNSDYEPILINQSNGVKTYKGKGLSTGNHTCYIKVSDGKQEVISNSFNIRIPQTSNDNIFESIELITPTTIKANTPTRVAIKLKSKANIDKKTIHPKIKDIGNKVKIYNAQWEKGNVLTDWRESVSEISDKTSSIKVGLENITSTVETIQGDYVTSSQIEQLDNSWTAKFKDGYHEGITSIDKDGITVTSNGVKSKTSMSANGFKITKTDTGEDVFKVNSDGTLALKGNITVTGGSVPTSNLTGTITANQIATNAITSDKLSANAIDGKTITGATLKGGTFFTAPNSNETDGYAFRIYNDGRVYSKNIIQVYGKAGNGVYAQLKDGVVTATEYMQTSGYKTENSTMRWGINDVTVTNPTGDNANRLEFTTIDGNKYFRPCYNGTVRSGSTSYPWYSVYSKNGVSTTSDRTMKENIRYIDRAKSDCFEKKEMYDFIKDDYALAQYNYINDTEEKISAIAQDLLVNMDGSDNRIGQLIVNNEEAIKLNKEGENAKLSINQTQLLNVAIGALQETMKKVEMLEKEIEELKRREVTA